MIFTGQEYGLQKSLIIFFNLFKLITLFECPFAFAVRNHVKEGTHQ